MGRKKKTNIDVTLEQAKLIMLARAIEESSDKSVGWTREQAEGASLRAAHALGENAGAARIIVERARLVLAAAAEHGASVSVSTKARLSALLAPLFVLAAYVLGALSDRIGDSAHLVNLLSPPFWTVIVWNFLVYIALALCALGILGNSQDRFGLPLRSLITSFVEKSAFSTLLKKGFKHDFYSRWSTLAAPLVRMYVARTLHVAAIAFALGLITSLLVRGFGTSYWAGWESTWLADNPQAVKAFLDATYGLIPSVGGLPPVPDVDGVLAMRADNLPYLKSVPSAAPWLIRMMLLMVLAVIIPRLVLVAFDSWRIRRFREHVLINIDDPYFRDMLSQCAEDAALGSLLVVHSSIERAQREKTMSLVRRFWGLEEDSQTAAMDFDDPESPAPDIPNSARRSVVLLWLDATQTPEADTHGVVLDKLKAACELHPQAVLAALIDLSEFSRHFSLLPARTKERENLWTAFVKERQTAFFVLREGDNQVLEAVKALRSWAAAQGAVQGAALAAAADTKDSASCQPTPSVSI